MRNAGQCDQEAIERLHSTASRQAAYCPMRIEYRHWPAREAGLADDGHASDNDGLMTTLAKLQVDALHRTPRRSRVMLRIVREDGNSALARGFFPE
jgi:hypothetical protein